MHTVSARYYEDWREHARRLISLGAAPESVVWQDGWLRQTLLPLDEVDQSSPETPARRFRVPKQFVQLARYAAAHRSPERWPLLYRILWRLVHGEPSLMQIATDDDVYQASRFAEQVRRDRHKMKAFVRFRLCRRDDQPWYIAWHRPDHRVVRLTAKFFAERFGSMNWMIMTPDESVSWYGGRLRFHEGCSRDAAPRADQLEALWLRYYGSIFNPARIKLNAMRAEMPVRYWGTLPETAIIDDLLADAPRRVALMKQHQENWSTSAADYLPENRELASLREAAATCQGCPLHQNATQTVFGEGPTDAKLVLLGEQPGDEEDRAGRPFVGPAGRLLNEVLAEAGLDRSQLYVTNAVKHFSFTERGKRRLHKKPRRIEVFSCRAWVEQELAAIRPQALVLLGATAAASVLGPSFRVTQGRGQVLTSEFCDQTIATFHPSAILRANDAAAAREKRGNLLADLKLAHACIAACSRRAKPLTADRADQ